MFLFRTACFNYGFSEISNFSFCKKSLLQVRLTWSHFRLTSVTKKQLGKSSFNISSNKTVLFCVAIYPHRKIKMCITDSSRENEKKMELELHYQVDRSCTCISKADYSKMVNDDVNAVPKILSAAITKQDGCVEPRSAGARLTACWSCTLLLLWLHLLR